MKVLHVLDHSVPQHSGYAFRTLAILREQRRLGWETAHVTSTKHPDPHPDADGVEQIDDLKFYRTPRARSLLNAAGPAAQFQVVRDLARRLTTVIDLERPDIVHAHSPALNGLAALEAGRRAGLPVVYEIRAFWEDAAVDHGTSREGGPRYRLTRALESRVIRRADHVTTICEGLRADILARGKAEDRVTVIPNAVDIERFPVIDRRDEALAAELGLTDAEVIGFIGSFYAYEGIPLIVEAAARLRNRRPKLKVLLVGGGPQFDAVRDRVRALGLEDTVLMPGRVPHDDVQRYYSLIDLLVYPRLSKRITELVTPLKPLEAMAQGRLVAASDVGGHRELIDDGRTGLLFRAGDPEALAGAAERVLDDEILARRLRETGRRFVADERHWPASVARYRIIYEGLTGAAASPQPEFAGGSR